MDKESLPESKILVAIVDDHPIVCDGLAEQLRRKGLHVLYTSTDTDDFLKKMARESPDVALVDLDMPKMDGEEMFERISRKHPETKVIIITSHFNPSTVRLLSEKGVPAILSKTCGIAKIVTAIKHVHEDGEFADEDFYMMVKNSLRNPEKKLAEFEEQQLKHGRMNTIRKKILKLRCMGYSTKEIAKRISRDERTVNWNMNLIWKISGVENGDLDKLKLWGLEHNLLGII
jgi:DNA-binding NarL/FixJ family response regulator